MSEGKISNSNHTRHKAYWKSNLLLIGILLLIWALVSFGGSILFVKWLNLFRLGGLPLGFWLAQQGAMYIFVILIFYYARKMDKLDHKFHIDEENNK